MPVPNSLNLEGSLLLLVSRVVNKILSVHAEKVNKQLILRLLVLLRADIQYHLFLAPLLLFSHP